MTFIFGVAIGVVLTVIGAVLIVQLQRERRRLAYEVLTAEVIIPEVREDSGLHIMVDSSLLGSGSAAGSPNREEPLSEVRKVYGFRVGVRNSGNTVIEGQRVSIELDGSARIISLGVESSPDLGGASIDTNIEPSLSNRCSAEVPFLNPGQSAILSIQSVDNAGKTCKVSAGGKGLVVYDAAKRRDRIQIAGAVAFMFGYIGVIAILGSADAIWDDPEQQMIKEMLSDWPEGWLVASVWLLMAIIGIGGFAGLVGPEVSMAKNRLFGKP